MSFADLIERTTTSVARVDSKLEGYYEGTVTLDALGVSLPPQVRVLEQKSRFPKLSVDVLTEVIKPEGFTFGGDLELPALLRRWWNANRMQSAAHFAITEALVQGAAFWVIGAGDRNTPRITAHTRDGFAVTHDHQGYVSEAVQRFIHSDNKEYAIHYLPGLNVLYEKNGSAWEYVKEYRTGATRPCVVPMYNRSRLKDVAGRSELLDILTTTDAASRTLTNLQVAQELLAMPTKYFFSSQFAQKRSAGPGRKLTPGGDAPSPTNPFLSGDTLKAYFGAVLTGPEDSKAGTIPGASLQEFLNTYKLYAQMISAMTGIPPSMLGISTDNPSSAEAMRVAKERLIALAETKGMIFGDDMVEVMLIALEMHGKLPENFEDLSLQWRDPATPSESSRSASLLQAHAQGVISAETAREGLRLSPAQLARENATSGALRTYRSELGG